MSCPSANNCTSAPSTTPETRNRSVLPSLLFKFVIRSVLLAPVSALVSSSIAVGGAGEMSTGTSWISQSPSFVGSPLCGHTPTVILCTPTRPLLGVIVTTPVELSITIARSAFAGRISAP